MTKLVLILALTCSGIAAADTIQAIPPPSDAEAARVRRDRRIGVGLLIGAGVCAALGIVFVSLAKSANNDILTNDTYHPEMEDRRNHYQATDTAFFTVAGVAFASGMVFTFGH